MELAENEVLSTIDFSALASIAGVLSVDKNPVLSSLGGFRSLSATGGLLIQEIPGLTTLAGLEALRTVSGDLKIRINEALTDISALSGVRGRSVVILKSMALKV